ADQQPSSNSTSSMILQTQEISNRQQFVPTQMLDNNNTNYNWLKQTNTLDSINTFMLPTLSTQTKKTTSLIGDVDNTNKKSKTNTQINIQNQKNDKEDDDIFRPAYFARRQNEKKETEKQFLNEIKLKQENQVEKYRIGELPDIQIRYSNVIIPLQALAQHDNHIARLLYASVFTSILNSLENKLSSNEYFNLIRTIQHCFDVMLSQSEIFYPLFVAALLDIILSKPEQIQISSQYISASTIASHLESIAKCYRSLANYDDVRGIFSQTSALNSYITALEQYPLTDEILNDSILELEHEFWTQSMLNRCNQLNNWTIMSKHIFIDNTTFDTL
ncbi:unnamed protein product, partial [Rotaria sordida]